MAFPMFIPRSELTNKDTSYWNFPLAVGKKYCNPKKVIRSLYSWKKVYVIEFLLEMNNTRNLVKLKNPPALQVVMYFGLCL